MKQIALLFLLTLCLLLTGCGQRFVSGSVVQQVPTETTGHTQFILRTPDGKEFGFLIQPGTEFFYQVPSESPQTGTTLDSPYEQQDLTDTMANVYYTRSAKKLTGTNGQPVPTYKTDRVVITYQRTGEKQLADSTQLDIWTGTGGALYTTTDRVPLLLVQHFEPILPLTMNQGAKAKIEAFFANLSLYDLDALLEQALAQHTANAQNAAEPAQANDISQFSHKTERVVYCSTSVSLPEKEYLFGWAFDKQTGTLLDNWDLFTCTEEQARDSIIELALKGSTDNQLKAEMKQALQPEWLVFDPDALRIEFPAGSLPSESLSYHIRIAYSDGLDAFMQPWALPEDYNNT